MEYKICKRNYTINKFEYSIPDHILDPTIFKVGEKYYFEYVKSSYSFVKSIYKFKIKNDRDFTLVDSDVDRFFCTPTEIRKLKLTKLYENRR